MLNSRLHGGSDDSRMRCRKDNGGCSHLCLISTNEQGWACACPNILNLSEDGKNCVENEAMLLISDDDVIRGISLDTNFTDSAVPIVRSASAAAMDFFVESRSIFWLNEGGIVTAPLDGMWTDNIWQIHTW